MAEARIFVTGASGLIGRAVLERIERRGGAQVVALSRRAQSDRPRVTWLRGDLDDVAGFAGALSGCDIVLHLGATTGRAPASVHRRVNLDATIALLAAARSARVPRFVFASSIAAGYPEHRRYPYAAAKHAAEAAIAGSDLDWTILRPTIVFGTASGPFPTLLAHADAPFTPLFGPGSVRVQPICVDDLAAHVVDALFDASTSRESIELGGAQVLSFRELLNRLRVACGRAPNRFLRLPLTASIHAAWVAERCVGARLPLQAGQLYAFRYDSTATPCAFTESRRASLTPLDAAIELLTKASGRGR